ncbi:MAG: GatB/YqeY domain-containing protein [Rhodospirillales bacterium]|nr:GatB/YqeY domain-containing protein [Alphaproteobacteria bacterium]MCB9981820.1 GatB/YqeY domain-containing protein [Rhodospirillales bacterium]
MEKREEFTAALKESLKAKDQTAMSTIRLILAALKDRDIAARGQGKADGIEESEILSMLQTMIKQRQEAAKIYCDAGREELAEREEAEIEVIQKFMPVQLGEEEVAKAVEKIIDDTGATGIKDMGKVMGALKSQYAGQIDMGKAGAIVKAKLG